MILFLIFGIISEIILKTYNDINWKYILIICIRIIGVLVNATYYCYQKYMMENLFLPYWNVAFVPGLVMFLLAFVFLGFCLASKDSKLSFIVIFYSFFKTDPGLGAGKIIIVFVLHTLMSPLAILILYHFGMLVLPTFHTTYFNNFPIFKSCSKFNNYQSESIICHNLLYSSIY